MRQLKKETYALSLVVQSPNVPWYARLWILLVIGYAFSPIDLIPDFIPVLGYLDDLLLVPLGILLAIKLVPGHVMEQAREQAAQALTSDKPTNWYAAVIIVIIWLVVAFLFGLYLVSPISRFQSVLLP